MRRRFFNLTPLFALAPLCVAACGDPGLGADAGPESSEGPPVIDNPNPAQLRIVMHPGAPAAPLEGLMMEYNAARGGSGVEIEVVPWAELQSRLRSGARRSPPSFDLGLMDAAWVGGAAAEGVLRDLTDWAETDNLAGRFPEAALRWIGERPIGSGRLLAIPFGADVIALAYRRDLFEDSKNQLEFKERTGRELRAPSTWDELIEVSRFFTRPAALPPLYGLALPTARRDDALALVTAQILWGSCSARNPDAPLGAAGEHDLARAIRTLIDLTRSAPPTRGDLDFNQSAAVFAEGRAAMALGLISSFAPDNAQNSGSILAGRAAFCAAPGLPAGDGTLIGEVALHGFGWVVPAGLAPDRAERVRAFIEWFTRPEVQLRWADTPGAIPASMAPYESEAWVGARPWRGLLAESVPNGRGLHGAADDFLTIARTQDLLARALSGEMAPEAAARALLTPALQAASGPGAIP